MPRTPLVPVAVALASVAAILAIGATTEPPVADLARARPLHELRTVPDSGPLAAARARQRVAHWYSVAALRHELARQWVAGVEMAAALQRAASARTAALRAQEEAAERRAAEDRRPAAVSSVAGSGRCGGDLPSCSIMECESGGSLTAQNPTSSASGKWQILDSSWGGFGGYAHASDAPEEVQDARARQLWAGGAGRFHWVC